MTLHRKQYFVAGGTLGADEPCYVERDVDLKLYTNLLSGTPCAISAMRQMGKSSLLVRVASRLRRDGVTSLIVDLSALGVAISEEQWAFGILDIIARQVDLEDEITDYFDEASSWSPIERIWGALREVVLPRVAGRLLLAFDEIDSVKCLKFSADSFFQKLVDFYLEAQTDVELRRLNFCLVGLNPPSELTSSPSLFPSGLFVQITPSDFALEQASHLSSALSPDQERGRALLERIFYWTAGHPYLTLRLCRAIADQVREVEENELDALCAETLLTVSARQSDPNLYTVQNYLLRGGRRGGALALRSLLEVYRRVLEGNGADTCLPHSQLLCHSGLLIGETSGLKIRNRIYAHVFDGRWVDEQLKGLAMVSSERLNALERMAMVLSAVALVLGA